MIRPLMTGLVLLLGLLAGGLLALFVRSFWIADGVSLTYRPALGPVEYRATSVISERGTLRAHVGTPTEKFVSQPEVPLGWQRFTYSAGIYDAPACWGDLTPIFSIADESKGNPDSYLQISTIELAIIFALFPAWQVYKMLRRRLRRPEWLCPACGYDIRASSGRCPECGMGIAAPLLAPGKFKRDGH